METFADDPGFEAVAGKVISPNRYSEFLSAFDVRQLRELQDVLIDTSLGMRKAVCDSWSTTIISPFQRQLEIPSLGTRQARLKLV